jgi:hypothetical protein
MFCKRVRFNVFCYWEFQHYKPTILDNEKDRQIVVSIMEELGLKNGVKLLSLMLSMADKLLDYKFWFREIKEY